MAGSTVTMTSNSNFRGLARDIFREMAYLSDASDGSVPDHDLVGLDDCELAEVVWDPDGTDTPANTFELRIEEAATGRIVYLSGQIDATVFSRNLGNAYTNAPAKIDGTVTVKIVDDSDHVSACNIGNAKKGSLQLRFTKK